MSQTTVAIATSNSLAAGSFALRFVEFTKSTFSDRRTPLTSALARKLHRIEDFVITRLTRALRQLRDRSDPSSCKCAAKGAPLPNRRMRSSRC